MSMFLNSRLNSFFEDLQHVILYRTYYDLTKFYSYDCLSDKKGGKKKHLARGEISPLKVSEFVLGKILISNEQITS